jgi:hypothetical protein
MHLMRLTYLIKLKLLSNLRIKTKQVNLFELKLNLSITLTIIKQFFCFYIIISSVKYVYSIIVFV